MFNKAGRVWNKHLTKRLLKVGFIQSKVDACVFYRGTIISVVYMDDDIFICPDMGKIDQCILDLRKVGYGIEDMGDVSPYLRIYFEKLPGGKIKLSSPHFIDVIPGVWVLPPMIRPRKRQVV
jgi:hypothetical protein